jgi:hypothetical protein
VFARGFHELGQRPAALSYPLAGGLVLAESLQFYLEGVRSDAGPAFSRDRGWLAVGFVVVRGHLR